MTPPEILQDPHPALRTVCAPVTDFGGALDLLCARMVNAAQSLNGPTLRCSGLAANQIGECVRVILVEDGGRTFMVNPVIVRRSPSVQRVSDGCFSVERGTKRRTTTRAAEIVVEYQDRGGFNKRTRAKGMRAAIIQHEVDHLDGKLFTDLVPGVEP